MDPSEEVIEVLRRIERNQQQQLQGQHKALAIQQEQFEMARKQFQRAESLQDRAEKMQESGAAMMGVARKSMVVILPIVMVLVIYLSWLIFR